LDEVQKYAADKNLEMDAQAFLDHYNSNGWMVGRNKMKCWRSAASGWARRQKSFADKTAQPQNEPSRARRTPL
jgi:hypothetical protein